eukprot:1357826-Rhodomonas_salina.3
MVLPASASTPRLYIPRASRTNLRSAPYIILRACYVVPGPESACRDARYGHSMCCSLPTFLISDDILT